MARLKLAPEIPVMLERINSLDMNRLSEIKAKGKTEHLYVKSFNRWFAWVVLRACFCPAEICNWYRTYKANDDQITTLAVHCCKVKGLL